MFHRVLGQFFAQLGFALGVITCCLRAAMQRSGNGDANAKQVSRAVRERAFKVTSHL